MSESLYKLTESFVAFVEYLDTCEEGEELTRRLEEALEELKTDIRDKLDIYAKVIKNKQWAMKARSSEIERLQAANNADERSIDYMKTIMKLAMEATIAPDDDGRIKAKTPFASYWIQKNPPSVVMDCQYIEDIPDKYLIPQEPKIDRKLLLEDLKSDIVLPDLEGVAHIEQSESLRIR